MRSTYTGKHPHHINYVSANRKAGTLTLKSNAGETLVCDARLVAAATKHRLPQLGDDIRNYAETAPQGATETPNKEATMNRTTALQYVGHAVDDTGAVRTGEQIPDHARLVGYQCGFEPMFVAVWSYLGVRLDDEEATELADDYLSEIGWFASQDDDIDRSPTMVL